MVVYVRVEMTDRTRATMDVEVKCRDFSCVKRL